ncbi:uncharacterized protein LOC131201188 [Ahaetulla prasina]|uniref:uncharacterized protein LOC131201188 n=1 Tax=Ahaetulla prasina TaxID=499056 RepID=UPI0026473719|nr:uncharacterized protein LOC131201188 [Ahaetulla prasina]XP_058044872.1 uncharacterized protein LOC131201188 [Ahaetulla prasina]
MWLSPRSKEAENLLEQDKRQGKKIPLIMNSSNYSSRNKSDLIQTLIAVKTGLYFINFTFTTTMSILIINIIRQNYKMRKEVRYFFLCHHLIGCTLFCAFGVISNAIQTSQVQTLWVWIIFRVQAATAESVLITLALMALNTCLAVCWPLRYLAFVHSVKNKVTASIWIGTIFKSTLLIIIEGIDQNPEEIFEEEPSCPTMLGGNFAKISGLLLVSLLAAAIMTGYILLCREGKLSGHFNSSNKKARKTIIIHGLQMSFHILPPLIIGAIGKGTEHTEIKFGAFVVFSFAQSFSPVVYGLRNKEMLEKLCIKKEGTQDNNFLVNNNSNPLQLQMTENPVNGRTTFLCNV